MIFDEESKGFSFVKDDVDFDEIERVLNEISELKEIKERGDIDE